MSEAIETRNFFPELQRNETPTPSVSKVVSYTSDLGPDKPIVMLIHGYPQTSFEWRYVAPSLKDHASMFIPELPGYGISSPSTDNNRSDIAKALVEALVKVFGATKDAPRKVIAVGHDRGARITHRLAVARANHPEIALIGAAMFDIVPTKVQWDAFSDPAACANYFHWPLLANVETAVKLLSAYPGGRWARDMNKRLTGSDVGLQRLSAHNALDVYAAAFDKEETLRYSCEDYSYGASPEYKHQSEDQQAGRKIDVPTLVMFSGKLLGSRFDVTDIWKDWIVPGTDYEGIAVGKDAGHFLPEEAHEEVSEAVIKFIKKLS